MTCMLNNALKINKPGDHDLYAPGQPCEHKCNEEGCFGKIVKIVNKLEQIAHNA